MLSLSLSFFLNLFLSLTFPFQSLVSFPPLPSPSLCPSFDIPISPLCVSLYPPFTLISDTFPFTFTLLHSLPYLLFCLSHTASDMSFVPLSHALPLLSAVTFFCTFLFPLLLLCVILFFPLGAFPSQTRFSTLICALSLLLMLAISCSYFPYSCYLPSLPLLPPLLLPKYPSLLPLLFLSLCLYHLPLSLRHAFPP